jgi:single-stranded DNA-binding protein
MSVNKVTLLGNTGKAPDFKEFDNGGCVATITLATTKRGFTTKDGRQIPERTEWHNIVLQNGRNNPANPGVCPLHFRRGICSCNSHYQLFR